MTNAKMLKINELAKETGFRYSTLKYYSEIGLLPFSQKDTRLLRRYDLAKVKNRLKEIKVLKNNKGLTICDLIKKYKAK